MRFVVFGGGGDMGRRAVAELAVTPGVELVTIVGRTQSTLEKARAEALAAQREAVNPATAEVVIETADARDYDAVVALMRRHDVALGALGPFYLYEEPMVKAAIVSRTPYVSLCDDAVAAAAALRYDRTAREAGVTIVTGLGWTPGLTNILARRLAARLDKPTDITVAWAGSAMESSGHAVALHTLYIFDGRVTTFADGRHVEVPAGSGSEDIEFPPPLGKVRVCHVGHPEPLTLPQHIPGVRSVALKGGLVEPTLHRLAVLTGRLGLARTHGWREFWARVLVPMIPLLSRLGPRRPAVSGTVVRVRGERGGRPVTLEAGVTTSMRAMTAVPLAVGALWVAQGRARLPGVQPPEAPGLFDPDEFLAELARRGVHVTITEQMG
ncbi:MAG: saccharopine dehydrogenase NADP-binding domain-containing protein [Limnochordales bacterium]